MQISGLFGVSQLRQCKKRSAQGSKTTVPGHRMLRVVGPLLACPVLMLSLAVAPALARNTDASTTSSSGPLVCDYAPSEVTTALADLAAGMSLAEACAQTGSALSESGHAVSAAAPLAIAPCSGDFGGTYTNGDFYKGKGKLQWNYYFNVGTQLGILGDATMRMPSAFIEGDGINPPYAPHTRPAWYDWHSSILNYQAFGVSGTRRIKTGEVLQMNWAWNYIDTNGDEVVGGSGVECTIPSGF